MNIYNKEGYLDIDSIYNAGFTYNYIISGKGFGKTYSLLDFYRREKKFFMLVRRQQSQLDAICTEITNPFKDINMDKNCNIAVEKVNKYVAGFFDVDTSVQIGVGVALSTFSQIQGFSGRTVTDIFYDECVPPLNCRRFKGESDAPWILYDTVNRNRELNGEPPVKMFLCGNPFNIAAPALTSTGIVTMLDDMRTKNQIYRQDKKRGLQVLTLGAESPIAQKKKKTALARLMKGTGFADFCFDNEFVYQEKTRIAHRNLIEYKPIVFVGEIAIYRHKSRDIYYCCDHRSGTAPEYETGTKSLDAFRRTYAHLWIAMLYGKFEYNKTISEVLLTEYFKTL